MYGAEDSRVVFTSNNLTWQRFQLKGKLCLVQTTLRATGEEERRGSEGAMKESEEEARAPVAGEASSM